MNTPTTNLTRNGITIRRRGDKPDSKYICRIKFRGKVHELTLLETAKESFEVALRARREIHAGRWNTLREQTALRQVSQTTLQDIFTAYRAFAGPDRPAATTREQNMHALTAILRDTLGDSADLTTLNLSQVNHELLWRWKEQKRVAASAVQGDDERTRQILRSANSRIRQARSVFARAEDLRTHYRMHQVVLPAAIEGFLKEPLFSDCTKDEYHAPGDTIIARTFAALETLGQSQSPDDRNMHLACWLALGFGLRAGDISQARASWFQAIDGAIYLRGDVLSKNKKFAEIRCQLGAWDRLGPHITSLAPDAYILAGTMTERASTVYRRISELFRTLGWQTTHHIHELRAWAGCQIAMAPGGRGLLDAQVFMRHAHYSTTEKFYGHHMKIRLAEVKLQIPTVTPTFQPQVLPAAEAS